MFAAIETRFGGNEATKKTQKTLLKQQYENFSGSSTESLDSIFNRLQKIVSRLAILGLVISQEDLNSKILSNLPPGWNTHVVVWMNKPEIKKISIDDFTSSTNYVNTAIPAYEVSTASFSDNAVYAFMIENPNGSNLLQQDLEQIHEDDLEVMDLKWQLSLLSMRAKRACRVPRNKEGQFRNQDNARKQGNNEDTSSKAMLAIDGVGFDWSDLAKEQVQTNMALMAFSDSEENSDNSLVKEQVSKDTSSFVESSLNVDKETIFPVDKKVESVKPKNHEKPVKKSVRYVEMYRSQTAMGNQRNWNGQKSNQLGSSVQIPSKGKMVIWEEIIIKQVNYKLTIKRTHPNAQRNMVPREVLTKTGLKPFNTARTVNTAHPKSTVFSAKPMSCFPKTAQSTVRRPFQSKTVLSNKRFTHKVITAKAQAVNTARPQAVNTARPKTVKTARPNSAVVNVVRVNQANAGKPQQDHIGFVDSGCSRHMTGNIAYLSDFKEFNGVYVTFGGGAHGGRISGKRTLKTDSLDFEDVYFVNELKFNLFSVLQMCDKKNYFLFTDTECPDENHILFKIPRKYNMYSFDMKNIVPKESLTCLVAKATEATQSFLFTWVFFLTTKNETSEILKNFIKEIENLVDKKVKIIRSDNGTEFKNKVMDDFCKEKGIKREYSVARTPQQNGVAERGFKPALSFMKPFGCHVTILNTLDSLGKFDGKSDEVAAGTIINESAGTQGELNAGTSEEISQDCIVMPIWKDASYFDSPSKDVDIGEPKSAADDQKQVEDGLDNENDEKDKSDDDSSKNGFQPEYSRYPQRF
ncbi:ribonuclease H-like domain-containing protein [Tanacetum coccineum]